MEVIYLSKSFGNNINVTATLKILDDVIINQNERTIDDEDDYLILIEDVDKYIKEHDISFIDGATGYQSDPRKKLYRWKTPAPEYCDPAEVSSSPAYFWIPYPIRRRACHPS